MRRLALSLAGAGVIASAALWVLSAPGALEDASRTELASISPDPEAGRLVFWAAGCASCHVAPRAEELDAPILAGGQPFPSDFGTFYAPNISSDPDHGIGGWTLEQFAQALVKGVSPEGAHYYPAFPYTSYNKARPEDIAHLFAFMQTLPADATPSQPHEVRFPFNIRRSLGLWKLMFERDDYVLSANLSEVETRGRYLVETLSHCTECHTPRNALGGLDRSRWMGGAPDPSGKGTVPNITPAKLTWSDLDLMIYLTQGFTPEYDTVGGHMTSVVKNLARLPEGDRAAIIAYLRKLPAVP